MLNYFTGAMSRTQATVRRPRRSRSARALARPDLQPLEPRVLLTAATLGVNLEGVADFSRSFMFADAMKHARRFGSTITPWDEGATVDTNGWPVGDAGATVLMVESPGLVPIRIDGTYRFIAKGDITVTPIVTNAVVTNRQYDELTDTTTADLVVNPGAAAIHLAFTGDPDGAKNIQLYRPGTAPGQTFTPEFLKSLQGIQTLRLMDYTRSNTTEVAHWTDRAKTTDARQSDPNKGGAWEYAIELANTIDADLWVNVPGAATDDYVHQMAALFHNTLEPGRNIYLEYSNEVWNGSFWRQFWANYGAAQQDAAANPSDLNYDSAANDYQIAWRRIAKRLLEIRDIFAESYGTSSINTTLRPVLASQIGWAYVLNDQLGYLQHHYGLDLSDEIYAVAGAPYMSLSGQLSESPTLTVDQVFQGLYQDLANMQAGVQKYGALAAASNLRLYFYESGVDLQGDTAGNFAAAKLPANYDPRMYDLIRDYMTSMFNAGVDGIMYYGHVSAYTPWGTWGLTDTVQDLYAPKLRGFRSMAGYELPALPAGGIGLPASYGGATFDAGSYLMDVWASTGGGGSIGGAAAGATYTYLLNVPSPAPAQYTLQIASASIDGSVAEIFIDGASAGQLILPATGAGTTFANSAPLNLSAALGGFIAPGHHSLKIRIIGGSVNLQSITIGTGGYQAPPPVQGAPATPAAFAAGARGSTQITLTWADVQGETGYRLERSTDGTTWTEIAQSAANVTSYASTGLSSATQYWFRVRAFNLAGESAYAPAIAATTALPAPTSLTATALDTSSVQLTWTPVAGTASYVIQRSLNGKTWTTLTRVSRNATTYTDVGLSAKTSYSYRLFAVSLDGTLSDACSAVTAKTLKK